MPSGKTIRASRVIALKDPDLVVATQGRALWVLDDLGRGKANTYSLHQRNRGSA